jgi:DNA replication and repair protein RecF
VHIQQLYIKNFRCFNNFSLDFTNKLALITGSNGSGKSSILEALHYGCYLRSFRTHIPRELIGFDQENFFIKIQIKEMVNDHDFNHELQIGFSKKKRVIKIDQNTVTSYKELSRLYRVITLTEDDLTLIKGSPEVRRLFLDQAISLEFPEFLSHLRRYKQILENRNALLQRGGYTQESYALWTHQLWQQSIILQEHRRMVLKNLELKTNAMLQDWFSQELTLAFDYQTKKIIHDQPFDDFWNEIGPLKTMESAFKRSLFGAHLDDFSIQFCSKTSRSFASRGQQKLIVMLIKIAQIQEIIAKNGSTLFLLDDFMTDFDQQKGALLLSRMLDLKSQLIFTCPTSSGYFEDLLRNHGAQSIELTR